MLLAIETATEVGSVALLDGDELVGERSLAPGAEGHAPALLVELDALLRETHADLAGVDVIALSIGPGSFTGLRIGLATALGLCFGTERRIVPVPTLAALSLAAAPGAHIVPMLDARKGEVYTGLYGPEAVCLREDRVTPPLPWLAELGSVPDLHMLGPGARLYRNEITSQLGPGAKLLAVESGWPRARHVGSLGRLGLARGEALAPERVRLRYLRASEAETRRAARAASGAEGVRAGGFTPPRRGHNLAG